MADLIILAGSSGTGKSRSLMNLDNTSTYIVNVLEKVLPWKGSISMYNRSLSNTQSLSSHSDIITLLSKISNEKPEIKTVVIDDAGFIMSIELFKRAKEQGYNKFTEIGQHMYEIIKSSKYLRSDLTVVLIFHTDFDKSDGIIQSLKIKTIGQMLEDKYEPLSTVTMAIFTHVDYNETGTPTYSFITNRTIKNGMVIPAKSPEGMFESVMIPNDLKFVIDTKNNYYS